MGLQCVEWEQGSGGGMRDKPELHVAHVGDLPAQLFCRLLDQVLRDNVAVRFRAFGTSMEPTIKDGDLVTLQPVNRQPRLGDTVACRHPETGKLVVHRVVRKSDQTYTIKGDTNHAVDGVVSKEDIMGLVGRIERSGRKVRFGLGPERRLIALASRLGLWRRFWGRLRRGLQPLEERPKT